MEFCGYIYDNKNNKRQLLDFLKTNREDIEHPINLKNYKKYFVRGYWIVKTNPENIKNSELLKHLKNSNSFAKILISTDLNLLKFDYAEKGYYKQQIIIRNGKIEKQFNFSHLDIKSETIENILDKILWEYFKLDNEFIEFHQNYLINVNNNIPNKKNISIGFDFFIIMSIPQAIIATIASPYLIYFTSKLMILIIVNPELWITETIVLILFAWLISIILFIYIVRFFYKEIRNFYLIKTKLLIDK